MDGLAELDAAEIKAWEVKEVQNLLNHRLVQAAFTATEDAIKEEWTRAETVDEREACFAMLKAFRKWKIKVRSDRQLHLTKE